MNGITAEIQREFHHWESILSDTLRSINIRGNWNKTQYIGILEISLMRGAHYRILLNSEYPRKLTG
jgi:hypothetical protein